MTTINKNHVRFFHNSSNEDGQKDGIDRQLDVKIERTLQLIGCISLQEETFKGESWFLVWATCYICCEVTENTHRQKQEVSFIQFDVVPERQSTQEYRDSWYWIKLTREVG